MYTIKFRFEETDLEPLTIKNVEPGWTLLEIALKNNVALHHNCGGVCSCTTCHLYIEKGMENLHGIDKRERDFITRANDPDLTSRLGCQSLLMDGQGVIDVKVPDQSVL